MSVITGTFVDGGVARARVPIRFTYQSSPGIAGLFGVTSRIPVTTETNEVGQFSQVLSMGDWEMEVDGHDRFLIAVPDDNATYDFVSRIIGAVTQSPTTPLAAAGIVVSQNETTLAGAASASSALRLAVLYTPASAGKNLFRWDNTSAAAHNGTTIINPTGNTGNGRWHWIDHATGVGIALATSMVAVETVAAMKAIPSASVIKGVMVTNKELADYANFYSFILGAVDAADGYSVIAPDDGLGRFFAK
jgi:hypothetical protein